MVKNKINEEEVDIQDVLNESDEFADCDAQAGDANVSDTVAPENDKETDVSGQDAQDWKDKYLRLSAEFDNYRKRTLKEKADILAFGAKDVIKAMLPVLDDMDRALDAMGKTDDVEAIRSGVELISQKMNDMLKAQGLKEIEAIGRELDTDFHEAVAKFAAGPENKGKIIDVTQKGYALKDKVIRHSKVVVGE
jgi:molecular chaperone GrpE